MKKHLKFVDSLGCCICGSRFATHHHLLRVRPEFAPPKKGEELFLIPKVKSKGMGTKSDDRFCLPLCGKCHFELHQSGNEARYLREKGIYEPERLALFIYENSGDFETVKRGIKNEFSGRRI